MEIKSGYVAIVGAPNAGKSTFINNILDAKIAITSDKINTTRNMIRGIYSTEDTQIIFVDTPGINKPQNKLQVYMKNQVEEALTTVDVILYIMDAKIGIRAQEISILDKISKFKDTPKLACINKIDLVTQEQAVNIIGKLTKLEIFDDISAFSLKEGFKQEGLISAIKTNLPEREFIYSKEETTDFSLKFYLSELIREKVLRNTFDEIPHGVYTKIVDINYQGNKVYIEAVIFVERDSQKGIVIGNKGLMIKKIGQQARYDIERYFNKKIFLELTVRVDKSWTNKEEDFFELKED